MKNSVVAGEYTGKTVQIITKYEKAGLVKKAVKFPAIVLKTTLRGFDTWDMVPLNKEHIAQYEVITKEQRASIDLGRGVIGGMMYGVAGAAAALVSSPAKGVVQVAVEFHDGKKSLLELDEKIYTMMVQGCF